MAAERNVPLPQGSKALSRPMREDAPAERMSPANDGESAMNKYTAPDRYFSILAA
jgi:hypothetical protein